MSPRAPESRSPRNCQPIWRGLYSRLREGPESEKQRPEVASRAGSAGAAAGSGPAFALSPSLFSPPQCWNQAETSPRARFSFRSVQRAILSIADTVRCPDTGTSRMSPFGRLGAALIAQTPPCPAPGHPARLSQTQARAVGVRARGPAASFPTQTTSQWW